MESRKTVFKETALVAIGQGLCCAAMIGIFALVGHCDKTVLLGVTAGGMLASVNFFFMAVTASLAANRAKDQNIKGGQALIRTSYLVRMALLILVLFALIKSELCHVTATVLPLTFTRPILTAGEFLRKPGEQKSCM